LLQRGKESSPRTRRVETVQQHVRDKLSEPLSAETLAALFGTSARRLNALVKAPCGVTVHGYGRPTRMAYAMHRLPHTDTAVINVAVESGYVNPANFATAFRQYSGLSPSVYRQCNRSNI